MPGGSAGFPGAGTGEYHREDDIAGGQQNQHQSHCGRLGGASCRDCPPPGVLLLDSLTCDCPLRHGCRNCWQVYEENTSLLPVCSLAQGCFSSLLIQL